jgi:hypothetical protein
MIKKQWEINKEKWSYCTGNSCAKKGILKQKFYIRSAFYGMNRKTFSDGEFVET